MTLRRLGMTCALAVALGAGANACETAGFNGLDDLRLHRPAPGAVVSGFGVRQHPLLLIARLHPGLDFAASHGDPVQAAAKGRVTFADHGGESGIMVRIDHGDGLATAYAHLSRIGVRVGDCVAEGAIIGFAGASGLTAGPQLHFEVQIAGKPVDPAPAISK